MVEERIAAHTRDAHCSCGSAALAVVGARECDAQVQKRVRGWNANAGNCGQVDEGQQAVAKVFEIVAMPERIGRLDPLVGLATLIAATRSVVSVTDASTVP